MFLLYHSEGCNICGMEFHKCYINNLRTITCSGMLGHRILWMFSNNYLCLKLMWVLVLRLVWMNVYPESSLVSSVVFGYGFFRKTSVASCKCFSSFCNARCALKNKMI
jgi:hypothetical protein